uniref:Uncharacterized protein n=1 Tax=Arundo donax TaxID=35708 RepID=A0A0A8YKM8_ARUDO
MNSKVKINASKQFFYLMSTNLTFQLFDKNEHLFFLVQEMT